MSYGCSLLRVPAAGQQWILTGDIVGCVLPCEREAVLLMVPSLVAQLLSWFLPQYSFLSRLKLAWGIRVCPPNPSPFSLGPRPVSSPPQVEPVLLPSPSRYLIAEEPELAPPWVWLLCRQDQFCFPGSAVATGIHNPHRRDVSGETRRKWAINSLALKDGKADSGA